MENNTSSSLVRGIRLCVLFLCALISNSVIATAIHYETLDLGGGKTDSQGLIVVEDLSAGIKWEWLDLGYTKGMSQTQALSGWYDPDPSKGFELAEMSDLTVLFNAMGMAEVNTVSCNKVKIGEESRCSHNTNSVLDYTKPLFEWFSPTYTFSSSSYGTMSYIFAFYKRDESFMTMSDGRAPYMSAHFIPGGNDYAMHMLLGDRSVNFSNSIFANFLVRKTSLPQSVPEPNELALLALGISLLAFRKKAKESL